MSKLEPILFLDDHRGIYIPRDFADEIRHERVSGVDADTWAILANPESESYWDVWAEVLDHAIVTDDQGNRFSVYQDGACWLIPIGMEWSDADNWYYWPEE